MEQQELVRLLTQATEWSAERMAVELPQLFDAPQSYGEGSSFPPSPRQRETRQIWQRILAEWILFQHLLNFDLPAGGNDFLEVRPFGEDTPQLRELLTTNGAVACFPLVGKPEPELVRLYLLRGTGEDQRKFCCNSQSADFLTGSRIFFQFKGLSQKAFDGESWQLAAALARKAQDGTSEDRRSLACRWIATGGCANDMVTRVEMGNKFQLKTSRTWLVPFENELSEAEKKRCFQVEVLDEAWGWIQKQMVHKANFEFPARVDELHLLVGGSPSPVVSCSLQIWPKRLYLWPSRQTEETAKKIQTLLREAGLTEIETQTIPSNNMEYLESLFKKRLNRPGVLVLGVTGGNRLMGFAAMLATQSEPKKPWIVYRDLDKSGFELQVLHYEQGHWMNAQTEINYMPPEVAKKVQWPKILDYKGTDSESLRSLLGL